VYCLIHKYNSNIEFGNEQFQEAVSIEKKLSDFCTNVKREIDLIPTSHISNRLSPSDLEFITWLSGKKFSILGSLVDDFDTPAVLANLQEIMNRTYSFLSFHRQPDYPSPLVLNAIYSLVSDTLNTFGLDFNQQKSQSNSEIDQIIQEFVNFRWAIRSLALSKTNLTKESLLSLCDDLRAKKFPNLGITIQDTKSQTLWQKSSSREKIN